ncbi:hypothetical protein OAW27_00050 [bacterium]|nr:hypothetical protein [bacterium]
MEKTLDTFAWVVLLLSVLYFGGHFIIATANAWDGVDLSTDSDISIDTGTRETITDTVIIEPGYDIPVTDSNGDTYDGEIISIMETPAGITQIEIHDYETNESVDVEMSIR